MRKKLSRYAFVAVAAMLALVSGCADNLQPAPVEKGDTYAFSVEAQKTALTKALTPYVPSGNQAYEITAIKATWEAGESVDVYDGDINVGKLYAQSAGASTTLRGSISTVPNGATLILKHQTKDHYKDQDGTLGYIASNCDYAEASVTVTVANNQAKANVDKVTFESKQAIVEFQLWKKEYNLGLEPSEVIIQYGDKTLDLTIPAATYTTNATTASLPSVIFVALPGFSGETVTITAKKDGLDYHYTKSDVTFANGKYYHAEVILYNDLATELTFEAKEAGAVVQFTPGTGISFTGSAVQYRTASGPGGLWSDWTDYTGQEITLTKIGNLVSFRGNLSAYSSGWGTSDVTVSSRFSCSGACYVYGNVMSLFDKTGFATLKAFSSGKALANLFNGNTNIYNHLYKPIVLPATTLTEGCYYRMFKGCTHLTEAPALPALTVGYRGYESMFEGCTGLISAPALPATTTGQNSYNTMFKSCTSLSTVPTNFELPITSMGSYCCYSMFEGCTSLTTAPNLPATTLNEACYQYMFKGCTNLTTVPSKLPATTLTPYCYEYMFYECTSLNSAPELKGETLAQSCYEQMFYGCKSLQSGPALSAETLVDNCYKHMFYGCTSLTSAPSLGSVKVLDGNCCESMFQNCTSLVSAPGMPGANPAADYAPGSCYKNMFNGCIALKDNIPDELPATVVQSHCYEGMFKGCTQLSKAPRLPAESLTTDCYKDMFNGCTALTSVTCMATTDISNGINNWLYGITTTGTLRVNPSFGTVTEATKVGRWYSDTHPATWSVDIYTPPTN